jgi:hypothetical protein
MLGDVAFVPYIRNFAGSKFARYLGDNKVCERRQVDFHNGDISDLEINRQDPTSNLRA